MIKPAQCAFGDHSFGQGNRWNASVIVADHVNGFSLLSGGKHLLALLQIQAERFFAEHMLAVFERGDGDFRVRIRGRGNIHDINER